jgi:hypothetical protein
MFGCMIASQALLTEPEKARYKGCYCGLCRVLMQEDMTVNTLAEGIHTTWADRDQLTEALRNAPPADGTNRVLEMIEEIQKK